MITECDKIYTLYKESNEGLAPNFKQKPQDREELEAQTPEDIFDMIDDLSIRNWYITTHGVPTNRGDEAHYAMTRVLTDKSEISIKHLSEMIDENQRQVESAAHLFKKFIIEQQQLTSAKEYLSRCDEVYKLFLQKYLDMEPFTLPSRGDHPSNLIDLRLVIFTIIRCAVFNGWSCRNNKDGWRMYMDPDCWNSLSDFVKQAGIEYSRKSLMQDRGLLDFIRDAELKSLADFNF